MSGHAAQIDFCSLPLSTTASIMALTVANTDTALSFSEVTRDPYEIRNTAAKLGDELGHENTYLELIRFLPTAVTSEFIDHLRQVADIEDLI